MGKDRIVRFAVRVEAAAACLLGIAILVAVHESLRWHSRLVDERFLLSPVVTVAVALFAFIAADLLVWGSYVAGMRISDVTVAALGGPLRVITGALAVTFARIPLVTSDVTPPEARLTTTYAKVLTSDTTLVGAFVAAALLAGGTYIFTKSIRRP